VSKTLATTFQTNSHRIVGLAPPVVRTEADAKPDIPKLRALTTVLLDNAQPGAQTRDLPPREQFPAILAESRAYLAAAKAERRKLRSMQRRGLI